MSGLPVIVDRARVLNRCDRTLIPKPFSRIFVRWGTPFYVPEHLDDPGFENIRKQIEEHYEGKSDPG